MRKEDIWDHATARSYDTPGSGMFAPQALGPTVDRLAGLAGDGRALEFAIGTGRVAVPLAPRHIKRASGLLPQRRPAPEHGYIALDTYDVLHQHVVSHHFTFGAGRQAQLFRSPHRYIWPSELDLMAELAGFELEARHADWAGTAFTAESQSHVSVYRLRGQALREDTAAVSG